MPDTIYTAKIDEVGRFSVYENGNLIAEGVPRINALLFEPESSQFVTLRVPSRGSVQAVVVCDGR